MKSKIILQNKKCKTCRILKNNIEFSPNKNGYLGTRPNCKACHKIECLVYRRKLGINPVVLIPKEIKQAKRKEYNKKYNAKNKLLINEKQRNRSKTIEFKAQVNVRMRHQYKTDLNKKLARNLRSRLSTAIKNKIKTGSFVKDLGCTISELLIYLENQFEPGMNWENWSVAGWHIDHIIPLCSVNLENREAFLKVSHYTNLRPIWAKEHHQKSSKERSEVEVEEKKQVESPKAD